MTSSTGVIQPNDHDHFVLRQRVRLVINQYHFSVPGSEKGDDGEEFCFVEQARFKFKEDIRFFTGPDKESELMRILARQRFDPRARYDITAADGSAVGQMQKVFGKSLTRSTFALFGPDGEEVAIARERSLPVALFRRFIGFIPLVGDVLELLPIPYDFELLRGEEPVGIIRRRRFKWRDIYDIDLSADTDRVLDRRLVLATAVGTDALMSR